MCTQPVRAIVCCHVDSCSHSLPEVKQCIFLWYISCPSVVRIVSVFYHGLISSMMTGMERLINNFCEEFPLVATHTSDGKKRKVTDTDTTNGNSPQKLLINQTIPVITSLINLSIADGVASGRVTLHALQTIASKLIVTDTKCSSARVFEILRR